MTLTKKQLSDRVCYRKQKVNEKYIAMTRDDILKNVNRYLEFVNKLIQSEDMLREMEDKIQSDEEKKTEHIKKQEKKAANKERKILERKRIDQRKADIAREKAEKAERKLKRKIELENKNRIRKINGILLQKDKIITEKIKNIKQFSTKEELDKLEKVEWHHAADKDNLPDIDYKISCDNDKKNISKFRLDICSHIVYHFLELGIDPLKRIDMLEYDTGVKDSISTKTGIYHYDGKSIKLPVLKENMRNFEITKRCTTDNTFVYGGTFVGSFLTKIYKHMGVDKKYYIFKHEDIINF